MRPILFYMFINDLDEGTEPPQQTLRLYKIAENTSAIQRHLGRLEKCADGNLMKFSNTKCRVLHQGSSHPEPQLMLGERAAPQTDRQTDSKLNMSQQQAKRSQAAGEEQPADQARWSFHCAQHRQCCAQGWAPQYKAGMGMLAASPVKITEIIKGLQIHPTGEG